MGGLLDSSRSFSLRWKSSDALYLSKRVKMRGIKRPNCASADWKAVGDVAERRRATRHLRRNMRT